MNFDEEKAFWAKHPVDRFDPKFEGMDFMGLDKDEYGDWICVDDYRKVVTDQDAKLDECILMLEGIRDVLAEVKLAPQSVGVLNEFLERIKK